MAVSWGNTKRSSRSGRDSGDRVRRPLDPAALDALAIRYVGRFATTRAKLAGYLRRKVRERGGEVVDETVIDRVVARCVAAGYVDDDAFAEQRATALGRRGFGHRRVAINLGAAGIERAVVAALAPNEDEAIAAAERFARRRRFGRFATDAAPREVRQRQFAAMLRAGHSSALARQIVEQAPDAAAFDTEFTVAERDSSAVD